MLNAIAARHGLTVIEDAAQSFGATYRGRRSAGLSCIGCTSFFPSKPLGCYGDGGALFTDDDELEERLRQIRAHGQDRRYHHPLVGVNSRLDTLQAAILLAKLDVFPDEVAMRQAAACRYDELLSRWVETPYIKPECSSVYAQYIIAVDDRDGLAGHLAGQGIPTVVHYPLPLHLQPAYSQYGCGPRSFPVAERAAGRVLSLPMSPYLTAEQVHRVAESILAWRKRCEG
ncbi:MAG: DegT/DnrJ/EryC1/StrS family aminotransferase [Negativicutes bacterium]|nr:DegT/DnrJ/EryC1/StrS family aminotransferase [Negativicutes bacterium]